jgi:hypothetical protein
VNLIRIEKGPNRKVIEISDLTHNGNKAWKRENPTTTEKILYLNKPKNKNQFEQQTAIYLFIHIIFKNLQQQHVWYFNTYHNIPLTSSAPSSG